MKKYLLSQLATIILSAFFLLISPVFTGYVYSCYLKPPSGYERMGGASRLGPYPSVGECNITNNQYFQGLGHCVGCSSDAGISSSGGYSDPSLYLMEQMSVAIGQAIGRELQNMLDPNSPDNIRQRQLEQQRQKKRQAHQDMEQQRREEEEERRRGDEEERRREDKERKNKMVAMMRGGNTDTLKPRDLGASSDLQLKEEKGAFGIKVLKPRDLSKPTQVAVSNYSSTSTLQKMNCAAYLLRKADEAAAKEYYEESTFLSNEAAALMSGAKESPSVVCPPLSEGVPELKGVSLDSTEMKVKRETVFFSRLYGRATQQTSDYRVVVNKVKRAEKKVEEVKKKREEAKIALKELEVKKQQRPESVDNNSLNEALAALNDAEEVYIESEKELKNLQNTKKEMKDEIKETSTMFENAKKDPEMIDEMMKRF